MWPFKSKTKQALQTLKHQMDILQQRIKSAHTHYFRLLTILEVDYHISYRAINLSREVKLELLKDGFEPVHQDGDWETWIKPRSKKKK
jgi:hypothetical protein